MIPTLKSIKRYVFILLSLLSSVFPPCSFLYVLPDYGTVLAWLEGVEKKGLQILWHASPKSIFGEFFSFLLKTRKATGRNRQYWGEGCLFLIWPGLPSILLRSNVRTTALWGKRVAQTREEKCSFLQNHGQNCGPSSQPLSLSNEPSLLPITRPSACVSGFTFVFISFYPS